MAAFERCPLLDVTTGICSGITLNVLNWPSRASFGTGGGFCTAKGSIAEQASCSKHPQHNEWVQITADNGNNNERIIVSKR